MAWAGLVCVAAGVGLVVWVGWQLWGTNVVAARRHGEVADQLRNSWATEDPNEDPSGQAWVHTAFGEASAIVRIPSFGSRYAVPVLEGAGEEALASGFGHLGDTVAGGRGNYVLAGHRITHGEPLRRMPELRAGDTVTVETRAATYTYVVDTDGDDFHVTDTDTWVTAPDPSRFVGGAEADISGSPRLLTLITCADFIHSPNRLVVFGHLIDQTTKP